MKIYDREKVIAELANLRYKQQYPITQLVIYLKETYDLQHSQAYDLINEMKQTLGDIYSKTNGKVLEEAIESLEQMKKDAYANKNGKLLLEIQKEIDKVNNLYIQKMEIDVKVEQPLLQPLPKTKE